MGQSDTPAFFSFPSWRRTYLVKVETYDATLPFAVWPQKVSFDFDMHTEFLVKLYEAK
jgi:hypothetical protein